MARPLSDMRLTYDKGELGDDGFLGDPINQFERWFEDVRATDTHEANAMIVSTVDANGRPSARIVLLKEVDCKGFVFYTNYESQKGQELAINQNIALTFYWPSMERQVRVTGVAERVSAEQSDTYFSLRPRGSQLGAIVSPQSAVIPDRMFLTTRLEKAIAELDENVPLHRPESWGGYLVRPDSMEFWQGRPDRLHDRIRYHREENGWNTERLAP